MNRLITSIIVCFAAIAAMAQTAEIEVSYTSLSPSMRTGNVDVKNQFVLLANASESKFFSPRTEYIDSLNSTPEGRAAYQEMSRNAFLGGKMDQLPTKDGGYYVVKNFTDNTLRYYDTAGLDKFFYDETPEEWTWQVCDSTKEVLGYECIGAKTDYHGRIWTVWFSPEIPVQNGPWKLEGLPGLILEAVSDDGMYSFVATGIQQTDKPIGPVYLADEYENTSRRDFLKSKRKFLDNALNIINAQLGDMSVVKIEDENGDDVTGSIFASRETVDLIETDY